MPRKTGEPFAEYVARVLDFSGTTKMRVDLDSRDKQGNALAVPTYPLRARATDTFVSPYWTEYNPTFGAEYYPVAPIVAEAVLTPVVLTAADPVAEILRPAALREEFDLYALRVNASALGAGRDINITITDGTDSVVIFETATTQWASGEDFTVYPVDLSTHMTGAVDLIGSPPLPCTRNQYIVAEGVGLAGAETYTLTPAFKDIGIANGVQ